MIEEERKSWKFWFKFIVLLLLVGGLIVGYERFLRHRIVALIEGEDVVSEVFLGEANSVSEDDLSDEEDSVVEKIKVEDRFHYQLLLHNQEEISVLKEGLQRLEAEVVKYKNNEKIAQMVLVYVDLRRNIYRGSGHDADLRSFELLAAGDEVLEKRITVLKERLPLFVTFKGLEGSFRKLIPDLLAAKNHDYEGGFFEKVKFNLAKIVTVRSLDGNNLEIDGQIVRISEALRSQDCDYALENVDLMAEKYRKILQKFENELKASCEVRKADENIMNYLETLT